MHSSVVPKYSPVLGTGWGPAQTASWCQGRLPCCLLAGCPGPGSPWSMSTLEAWPWGSMGCPIMRWLGERDNEALI